MIPNLHKDPTGKTLLIQEALKARGFYNGALDNEWGIRSETAYKAFLGHSKPKESTSKGSDRTDWRGYKEYDRDKLESALPIAAKPLVDDFFKRAKEFDLNPLFLIAISRHETGNWTSNVFRYKSNAMGISDAKGAVALPSYDESIRRAAYSLGRPGGFYSKARTLADVGSIYAPVGAANDPTKVNRYWPDGITKYWNEYETQLT